MTKHETQTADLEAGERTTDFRHRKEISWSNPDHIKKRSKSSNRRARLKRARRRTERMNAKLEKLGVRKIRTYENLHDEQTKMLARFAKAGIPEAEWTRLKKCDGAECPNKKCSAACWFGERGGVSKLNIEAVTLLQSTGMPIYLLTTIDPYHRRPANRLDTLSLDGVQQTTRRRFRDLEAEFGKAHAIGGIEPSYDVELNGKGFWSPHSHIVVATEASRADVKRIFRPRGKIPRGLDAVDVREISNLANAISYALKRDPEERSKKKHRKKRRKDPVSARQKLELDRWLLSQPATALQFMRGIRRVRGTLSLLNKKR